MPSRIVWSTIVAISLALSAALFMFLRRADSDRSQDSRGESMRGWQPISGHWTERRGTFQNSNYGRGDMLIAQHSQGTDYHISADIRFDLIFPETHYGDAGLVIRTTNPEEGVDSYQGYYAGLRPDQQTVVLGRASYEWHPLANVRLATPVSVGAWYLLELSVQACKVTVTVTPEGGRPGTHIDHEDNHCLAEGVAGLRSFYAQASWRNVKIAPN